jgi:YfiH family protein
MKKLQAGSIRYYKFIPFENQGLYQAVFTRHGGLSPSPWKSLNLGASVGDDNQRVARNREMALAAVGVRINSVYDVYQVHSTDIIITDKPLGVKEVHKKADAIITRTPGVTLMMRFADCVPVFFFDPVQRVIGLAHAGWVGTINKIASKTINEMRHKFGSKPGDILAAIGPSIGPDHYSVGSDVIQKAILSFGHEADSLFTQKDGKIYFNLWEANRVNLMQAGVDKIDVAGICTNCHLEDWYSHRGEHGKTGRFGAILGLCV